MVYGCPSKKPSRAAKVAYGCPSKNPSRASKAAGDQPKVIHMVGSELHALKQKSKNSKDKVEPNKTTRKPRGDQTDGVVR